MCIRDSHHAAAQAAIGVEALGVGQEAELHAVFDGFFVFLGVGRDLGQAAPVDHRHVLHAGHAQCCAGAVHRGVAGTDHRNVGAQVELFALVEATQEVQRLEDLSLIHI